MSFTWNTGLEAKRALAHRLQCCTTYKIQNWPQRAPRWPTMPEKVIWCSKQLLPNKFLSRANKVSTGPICQFLCVSVSVFVWTVYFQSFLKCLIRLYTCLKQGFWHPTYPTRCFEPAMQELG